jgi:hypothetical protein
MLLEKTEATRVPTTRKIDNRFAIGHSTTLHIPLRNIRA